MTATMVTASGGWARTARASRRRLSPRLPSANRRLQPLAPVGRSTNTAPSGSHTRAAGRVRLEEVRSRVRVSSAGTSGPEKPCWYCEPHVARDAVAQRLTWPHSTRLSVTDAVRRSPADCPHVRPLRSRISVRACGAGGSQYQHGSFGLSHAGSRLVVRLDDRAHQVRVSSAGTSGPEKPCLYREPHVARDAGSQRPDVAALDPPVGPAHSAAGRPAA